MAADICKSHCGCRDIDHMSEGWKGGIGERLWQQGWMEPEGDCQKAGSSDLDGASSGATTGNSRGISARSSRRWLSWPFGKSHRFNLQLQSSTRLEVSEDAGIKEVPTQEQVANRNPLKEASTSTEANKEDGNGDGREPNPSRSPGRQVLLIHKLKQAFVVWARQKMKAKKANSLKSKRRINKTIKGKRLKTQTSPDSASVKTKDEISREAAASYIRNAFERFKKLGASPNAAAANALREMAGLAPVFKAKACTSGVPQMLLPPVSWGAFEPATCTSDDAEAETIEETLNDTILDTQSTQLDPETQDANGDEEDALVTMKRQSPGEPAVPAEDQLHQLHQLPTAHPDEAERVKQEAKPQTRRSKANAQKREEAPSSRRTGRQRMPPLEHWKNERCVYERKSGSSVPSLAAVVKCPAEAQKISSVDSGKGKRAKVVESTSTSKRKRKDNMAAESAAESADGDLTDHDDAGFVSLPMPSIYDIVDKKDKKGKKKSESIQTPDVPKAGKVKGNKPEAVQKESVAKDTPSSRTSKGIGAQGGQSSPPRGLLGVLEAARMEATRMRDIARPLASANSSAPSLNNFRGKPSLAAMAAAAAAAVGNGPSPARTAAKPAQRRARK
eukprot:s2330_g3.t2